jgi:dUTPase
VPMVNNTEKYFHIHPGDRIAQLELVREIVTDVYETEERPEQKTDRDGGFGSTGV